ncbi:MAG: hypothetical protein NC827_07290 [Candidatus Omnitrophica bacterium]|nr:hypothetical protein [Candidatus Omnitrophota bacterium]
MKKLIKKFDFVIILSILFNLCSFVFASEVEKILQIQNKYFQKLYSAEFSSKVAVSNTEEIMKLQKLPINKFESGMNFILKGTKYRSEVPMGDGKGRYVSLYNGEKYQFLEIRNKSILFVSSNNLQSQNPYNGLNPLLVPFMFVFQKGDAINIETLQKPDIWLRLTKEAVTTQNTEKFGHKGINIIFYKKTDFRSGKEENYEVFFAEDLNYFPIYWKGTDHLTMTFTETKVLETKIFEKESGSIVIPIRIEVKAYFENGKLAQTSNVEIDINTLKINQPVRDEVFTIPISQVDRVYDADLDMWFEPNKK